MIVTTASMMMTRRMMKMSIDVYQMVTDRIIAMLEQGEIP